MKSFIGILASFVLSALPLAAADASDEEEHLHAFHHENVLGTSLELKFATPSDADAAKAESAALAEIDRLARILSAYDPASEFSQWFKTSQKATPISTELFEVLDLFDQWRTRSSGALDPAAEAVCRLWKTAAEQQRLPSPDEIAATAADVRKVHWKLDAARKTATHLSDVPLAMNSFVKSYIASRACDAAVGAAKITGAIVNIGGDLVVRGELTEPVDITDPRSDAENSEPIARLQVRNRTVATSGNYRRGVRIGDRWYSHIVDPRTGQPVDHVISATVVASSATDAGALATSFCVLAPEESLRLAASLPEVECLLITKGGRRVTSSNWRSLEVPRRQFAALGEAGGLPGARNSADTRKPEAGGSTAWDTSLELLVSIELNRIAGQRAARPYVAVWIEDKDKFPVRTLALWYNNNRWLPDLKSWYRGDQLRALADGTDLARSVSSATRSPGKYTLKWDGKDDQGKLAKAGKYTVCIEAAREHGTYQMMRQEMEFAGAPRQIQLAGNVEVASASLDYHKKTQTP